MKAFQQSTVNLRSCIIFFLPFCSLESKQKKSFRSSASNQKRAFFFFLFSTLSAFLFLMPWLSLRATIFLPWLQRALSWFHNINFPIKRRFGFSFTSHSHFDSSSGVLYNTFKHVVWTREGNFQFYLAHVLQKISKPRKKKSTVVWKCAFNLLPTFSSPTNSINYKLPCTNIKHTHTLGFT